MGAPHILGADGAELPPGEIGTIWFEGGTPSEYHGDPGKTAAAANERGWRTVGDVGHLDRDGYLYLTDRAGNLIISGGVNIYPQEIENVLTLHPDVLDAAVLGVPDPEMGEQVKAVVQVKAGAAAQDGPAAAGRRSGTGGPARRLLPRAPGRVQVPALLRVHHRGAADPGRQDPPGAAARAIRRGPRPVPPAPLIPGRQGTR